MLQRVIRSGSMAVAAAIIAGAPQGAVAATWLITSYTGGTLSGGTMSGGALNDVASLNDATANWKAPVYESGSAVANGFNSGRLGGNTQVPFQWWVTGGGIIGSNSGATNGNPTPQHLQQQLYDFNGPNNIAMVAGQHVLYDSNDNATGYMDVTDISNRSIEFFRMVHDGDAAMFVVDTTATGQPTNFTTNANGFSMNVIGSSNFGSTALHPISSVDLLNADAITLRSPNPEKNSFVLDGYVGSYFQLFLGTNTNPTLLTGTTIGAPNFLVPDLNTNIRPVGQQMHPFDRMDSILEVQINNGAAAAGAVPEPSTWAIMIGGLGMIGAVARRRRLAGPRRAFA